MERVEHIFRGQYLWLEARVTDAAWRTFHSRSETAALARASGADEEVIRQKWLARLQGLKDKGKVALGGAGAEGATFANLVDPDCALIDCVIDLNPNKQGRYISGTGCPIVAPADLPRRAVKSAVLMNQNHREENLRLPAGAGIEPDVIDGSG